jgi:hypothetical protein
MSEQIQNEVRKLKCKKCLEFFPETDFHVNRYLARGRKTKCKPCLKKEYVNRKQRKKKEKEKIINISSEQDYENLEDFDIRKEIWRKNEKTGKNKLFHFSAIYQAQSRSGKSTNLMYQLSKIRDLYDIIILITESPQAGIYKGNLIDFVTTGKNYKKIIQVVRFFQRKTENFLNFLIILDDFAKRNDKILRNMFTNARNSKISVIHSVQSSTMVNNQARYNTLYVFLFNQKNSEAILRTINFWLYNFIATPKEIRTKRDKIEYLKSWFLRHTQNYTSMVLNIDKGKVMISKAPKLD